MLANQNVGTQSRVEQRVFQPGNGTRYWIIRGYDDNGQPFVALPDFRKAATMGFQDPHPIYVAEKLGMHIESEDVIQICRLLRDWETA